MFRIDEDEILEFFIYLIAYAIRIVTFLYQAIIFIFTELIPDLIESSWDLIYFLLFSLFPYNLIVLIIYFFLKHPEDKEKK